MRVLAQRVSEAVVQVDGVTVGRIDAGVLALVGVTHGDDERDAVALARKLWHLRIFDDEDGVMNRSLADTHRAALVVSQFTLYGDVSRGRRPSWTHAAPPAEAEPLVDAFAGALAELGADVATGRFGARMAVTLTNDGPVTLLLDS